MVYQRTKKRLTYKATRVYPTAPRGSLLAGGKGKKISLAQTAAIARAAAATAIQAVFRSKRARKIKVPAARRRLSNRKKMYRKNKMRSLRYGRKPGLRCY